MKRSLAIFWVAVVGVIFFWVGTLVFIPKWYNKPAFGPGTFGDMFGVFWDRNGGQTWTLLWMKPVSAG